MSRCLLRVCRDCCCGTLTKHPDVDHDGLLDRLRDRTAGAARVDVSGCLLACDRSDVVVVSPSRRGRHLGARPVWVGEVLDERTADALADWVCDGGPGLAAVPERLRGKVFRVSALAAGGLA
ncbi:MAG: hypothetical protein ACXVWU_08230 [Nocardioides sp.]